ncbi:TPA: hypothetical protein MAQ12_004299 [Klebsiella pneumoniae]|uniref:hypothetical protein n=1 Tax=Klebsiella pneumoniae complex TaxID=3390273 RepID=UPI001ABC3C27|nr:hypothetical protein [Klebsiella pneumoniae]MCI8159363.1 hypothetical protein [Klebsiella pneumoniae]WKI15144.1 hypothetical protein QYQ42_07685 [Klebsiella pneumoniae]HBS7279530.1 hypothetical protein [Klebsiella pneumoniae]HEH1454323.1 hypothetical protein [Klebsiella pneumoniae]
MTITLQAVNELIASLESAGELSIREQKFLKLAKAYQQLAAENVALKSAITDHSQSVHFCEVCGMDDPCRTDDVCYVLSETPATDRIVAGIKADAIDEAAVELDRVDTVASTRVIGFKLREFSQQLREGAK